VNTNVIENPKPKWIDTGLGHFIDVSRFENQPPKLDPETERRDRLDEACQDVMTGEPPSNILLAVTLSPARARFARYTVWHESLTAELAELGERKEKLENLIVAPAVTESRIASAVRRTADWLLGRIDEEPSAPDLQTVLAQERHRAEAARAALAELKGPIEIARERLRRLTEREREFLGPALIDIARESGLAAAYRQKLSELDEIANLLFGLAARAGGFGTGIPANPQPARLPNLTPARRGDRAAFTIGSHPNIELWKRVADALRREPGRKASSLVSLPRSCK
jgi:hypothetical protein